MHHFEIGDRIRMRNPHFPDKRPSRHKVTGIRHDAGASGTDTMLILDGAMGAPPEWCEKPRISETYPEDDYEIVCALRIAAEAITVAICPPNKIGRKARAEHEAALATIQQLIEQASGR